MKFRISPLFSLFRPFDWAVLGFAALLSFSAFFAAYGNSVGEGFFIVSGEEGRWVFPETAETTLRVAGPLGTTVVAVSGGSARIVSSPCPAQSCVSCGEIRLKGSFTACLPNRVMVRAESGGTTGKGGATVDAGSW